MSEHFCLSQFCVASILQVATAYRTATKYRHPLVLQASSGSAGLKKRTFQSAETISFVAVTAMSVEIEIV